MISVEGAGVLAQVVPVGVLVLAIELGRVERFYATNRSGRLMLWGFSVGLLATVLANVQTEVWCVMAVSSNVALTGFRAGFVYVSAYVLAIAVALVLCLIISKYLGVIDALARRGLERALADPAEASRRLEYILRTHPELVPEYAETLSEMRRRATEGDKNEASPGTSPADQGPL